MPHRLQITISETHYAFLSDEAARSSVSMAELIRRAIDTTYAPSGTQKVHLITHVLGRRAGIRLRD